MDGQSHELASVLSLSLHRLQRAPRAIHRAFLSRPSIYRPLRNVKGIYRAESVTFLGNLRHNEICLGQMIAQARHSIVVVGKSEGVVNAMVASVEVDRPTVKVSRVHAENLEQVVIVDDRVAWLGTGDLGVVAEGEIARALNDCFRLTMHRPQIRGPSNWPLLTRVDLDQIDVAISRTWTSKDLPPVIESERLILSALRSARRFVYIETQALTSPVIVNAIAARLKKEEAPEIVIMLPDQKRARLQFLQRAAIARLIKADLSDKLRIYHLDETVNGLLIVDDQFVKIGSAQMTSHSLGAARAVDVSVEAVGRPGVVTAVARLRRERIGRWLKLDPSEFDARFLINGSLTGTIESFLTPTRTLREISEEATPLTQIAFTLSPVLDPKRPQALERWLRKKLRFGPKTWRFALIFIMIFALLIMFSTLFAPLGL